jgi:hypothetical protein
MDAVTYPDEGVARFLAEKAVCYKPRIDEEADLARRYGVKWTPGLVWLDGEGHACHQNVGFLDPREFLAESTFALGRVAACADDWAVALDRFEEVTGAWPATFAAPAALYWAGVAAKKDTGEVAPLLEKWKKLRARYRDSAWAMKVSFLED